MTNFEIVGPDYIASCPEAIAYLERGAFSFGGTIEVEELLKCPNGPDKIFVLVKNERKLRGAIFLTLTSHSFGLCLTSVLLGGDDFSEWQHELSDFYYDLARKNDCEKFFLMGRRGFKRYFPELKEVATVYSVDLKPHNKDIN